MAAKNGKAYKGREASRRDEIKKEIIEGVYFQHTRPTVAHLAVCLPQRGQGRVQFHLCTEQEALAGSVSENSHYLDPSFIKRGSQDPRGM